MYIGTDQIRSLVKARRLLLLANQAANPRPDVKKEGPSFKDILENGNVSSTSGPESKSSGLLSGYSKPQEDSTFEKLT